MKNNWKFYSVKSFQLNLTEQYCRFNINMSQWQNPKVRQKCYHGHFEKYAHSFWLAVLVVKNPPAKAGDVRDTGSASGLGRCPGGGHSNTLQYSCLENPMDQRAWQAAVHRVAQSWTDWSDLFWCWVSLIWYQTIGNLWFSDYRMDLIQC